jgi:hypothetical protein
VKRSSELATTTVSHETRRRNFADAVIENMVAENGDLAADVLSFRSLARCAIHRLHDLQLQHHSLQEQHQRVVGDYRRLREQVLLGAL